MSGLPTCLLVAKYEKSWAQVAFVVNQVKLDNDRQNLSNQSQSEKNQVFSSQNKCKTIPETRLILMSQNKRKMTFFVLKLSFQNKLSSMC